jgi:Arm DNA-binding domain
MPKLTKRLIDTLCPDLFAWDNELRGFEVRMKPSGSASYFVQYRTAQGKTRRFAFNKVGTITPDEARTKAKRFLAEVAEGADPSAQRHEAREALTVVELCDRYLEAARAGLVMTRFRKPKRASTVAIDEGRVSRHIMPLIGSLIVRNLTRAAMQHQSGNAAHDGRHRCRKDGGNVQDQNTSKSRRGGRRRHSGARGRTTRRRLVVG